MQCEITPDVISESIHKDIQTKLDQSNLFDVEEGLYTPKDQTSDYQLLIKEINEFYDEDMVIQTSTVASSFLIGEPTPKLLGKYTPGVAYQFKGENKILANIDKIRQLEKSVKTPPILWEKLQQDLQIPKDQVELLRNSKGSNVEEKLANFLANYSYTVEINTAKEISKYSKTNTTEGQFFYGGATYEDRMWDGYFKNNIEISQQEFQKVSKEYHSKRDTETQPTQHYSNLTVPGGTNYTENEIATPAIVPSIQSHAAFKTENGIGWFRSDDKQNYNEQDIDILINNMKNSGVLEINCS